MALSLDGSGTGTFSTTNTGTVAVTTTHDNDIIVLLVFCEKNGSTQSVSATYPRDTDSLTWYQRKQLQWTDTAGNTAGCNVEVWWAHQTTHGATTITVDLTAATDDAALIAFGVNGCANYTNPWDGNASLPATQVNTGASGNPQVTNVSTTNAHTFIFGLFATSSANTSSGGTGSDLADVRNTGGTNYAYLTSRYEVVATAQSGITFSFTITGIECGMIVDALTDLPPPVIQSADQVVVIF